VILLSLSDMFGLAESNTYKDRSAFGWLGLASAVLGAYFLLFTANHPPLSALFVATGYFLAVVDGRRKKAQDSYSFLPK